MTSGLRKFLDWFTGGLTARPEPMNIAHHAPDRERAPKTWRQLADDLGPDPTKRAELMLQRFPIPPPPPAKTEEGKLAMDSACASMTAMATSLYGWASMSAFGEGICWYGFTYLAELQQRPEYRRANEITAQEMTRKWIKLTYSGDDKTANERLAELEDASERYKLRGHIRRLIELDCALGRSHLYVDVGDKGDELAKPLLLTLQKIPKGSLKAFRVVEPMWVYPDLYNSSDPLAADFYCPSSWFVQGVKVSATRLIPYIGREVPDILKPSYSFGGLSLTQMGKPYVDNWLRTRQSVSDTTHSYSVFNLATNMSATFQDQGVEGLKGRAYAFNFMRDNNGLNVIDKGTEELTNVSAPLTTLDNLLGMSQEQMCAVWGIPLVKYLGVTPSGLNASSDGEIRAFYDGIHAAQEKLSPIVMTALQVLQLNEFGAIDPHIGFEWVALWQLDDTQKAANQKVAAEAAQIYVNMGAISNEEVRGALVGDDESPYAGLDADDMPDPPEPDPADPTDSKDA